MKMCLKAFSNELDGCINGAIKKRAPQTRSSFIAILGCMRKNASIPMALPFSLFPFDDGAIKQKEKRK